MIGNPHEDIDRRFRLQVRHGDAQGLKIIPGCAGPLGSLAHVDGESPEAPGERFIRDIAHLGRILQLLHCLDVDAGNFGLFSDLTGGLR